MIANSGKPTRFLSGHSILLALLSLVFIWACTGSEGEGDQYLTWNLSESLAEYDLVKIDLVATGDTGTVYDVVLDMKKLPDPKGFPRFKLVKAKGKDFTIRIRGFNSVGELVFAKDIQVVGPTPKAPVVVLNDVRIGGISVSPGALAPPFHPDIYAYTVQVAADAGSIALTPRTMDAGSRLILDDKPVTSGQGVPLELRAGANAFVLSATGKDGRHSQSYEVIVYRGEAVTADKVLGVTLAERNLVLYTKDTATYLIATVDPPGALMRWSTGNGAVARVDARGKITPVEEGATTVSVTAGSFSDVASVEVKKGEPELTVGSNRPAKPNAEVEFPIDLKLTHAKLVSFKYDLDGDDAWDASDSTVLPASLTHSYSGVKAYTAHFYVADSRGNQKTFSRIINVSNASLQVSILSPSTDTFVNVTPLKVRYTVNGTTLTKDVPLVEGAQDVVIDTVNGGDSGSSAPVKVTLDTNPPKAPNVIVASPTDKPRPTWSWTAAAASEGNGTFRAGLDSAKLGQAPESTVRQFVPATDLGAGDHVLYVQERDMAGNWSPFGKAKVTIQSPDNVPPNAPKVFGTTPTGSAPKWTWTTGGAGGSGIYRYKVDDTTLSTAAETKDTALAFTGTLESKKTYTLRVQERDAAGNWSLVTAYPILYDATQPGLAIVNPLASGTYITKNNFVTLTGTAGGGPFPISKVSYTINGSGGGDASFANNAWSVTNIPLAPGSTLITVTATDNQGGKATQSLTVLSDAIAPSEPKLTTEPATPTTLAKGTFAWSAGADNANGSNLNGRYQYRLNGGAWKDTSATLLNDINLIEGATVFEVQEQDFAGNWSVSATSTIKSDRTVPKAAITSPAQNAELGSLKVTLSGTASDAGTGIQSVVITGQASGAAAATVTGGTWTSAELTLAAGSNTLTATATDGVGNTFPATVTVTVKTAAPAVDITYPITLIYTNLETITVKYTVNGGAEKSQAMPLNKDGLNLLTITEANPTGAPGTDTVSVFRDQAPPTAPGLTAAKTPTNTDPAWNFTTAADNAGGSGMAAPVQYQYQVNGTGAFTALAAGATSYTRTGATEGTYSLIVQQKDKAGNWSTSSVSVPIVVDKTPNIVSVKSPLTEYVTNNPSISLVCILNGADQPAQAVTLTKTGDTVNVLTCSYPDAAGNPASASVKVWYRPTVWFVKSGTVGGDGSSWAKAYGTIRQAMAKHTAGTLKQIWVAGGSYDQDPGDTGLVMKSGLSLYGGFNPASQTAIGDRIFASKDTSYLNATEFSNIMTIEGKSASSLISNVTIDGFSLKQVNTVYGITVGYASGITLKNLQFNTPNAGAPTAIDMNNATVLIDNCVFSNYNTAYYIVSGGSTANVTINNSVFRNNILPGEGGQVYVYLQGPTQSFTSTQFLDNPVVKYPTYRDVQFASTTGTMSFTSCTFTAPSKDVGLIVRSSSPNVTYSAITWIVP
jgi:hypothetical protein